MVMRRLSRRRQSDVHYMTQQIIAGAGPLGISVHDRIIVGEEGRASLKGQKGDLATLGPRRRMAVAQIAPGVGSARRTRNASRQSRTFLHSVKTIRPMSNPSDR
jgi:hypothetical protein